MAEEKETPSQVPLTSILSKVHVTEADAIGMLSSLANANADKSPTLVASLNKAIADLSNPSTEAEAKEHEHESHPTPTGTSRPR